MTTDIGEILKKYSGRIEWHEYVHVGIGICLQCGLDQSHHPVPRIDLEYATRYDEVALARLVLELDSLRMQTEIREGLLQRAINHRIEERTDIQLVVDQLKRPR